MKFAPGQARKRSRPRRASRYARPAAILGAIVTLILGYVGLTAELTAQTYRLSADQSRHAALVQTTVALQQRLAQFESLPQLERAAARLHMTDPHRVVVIALPALAQARHATTFAIRLGDFAKWFKRE